jgi:acyl-CoA thioester hydrolase
MSEKSASPGCDELLAGYPVVVEIQVRWRDMDALGHVNNVQYYEYFEMARITYLERLGVWHPGGKWIDVGVILASNSCRYKAPVTYPDTVLVGTRVSTLGIDRVAMENLMVSRTLGVVAAEGKAVVVSYDYRRKRKRPWSEEQRAAFIRVEGREPPAA